MGDDVVGEGSDEGAAERPRWQSAPCPQWCVRDHREEDHPDDRYHQSEASTISVLADTALAVGPPRWAMLELVVRLGRYQEETAAWIRVEAAEQPQPCLLLSVDSARLLGEHLHLQLSRHDLA